MNYLSETSARKIMVLISNLTANTALGQYIQSEFMKKNKPKGKTKQELTFDTSSKSSQQQLFDLFKAQSK